MRKVRTGVWVLVAFLAVGMVAFVLSGSLLRSERRISLSVSLNQPPTQVYAVLTDYARLPEWFNPCVAVDARPISDGTKRWVLTFATGEVVVVNGMEVEPPSYLIWRMRSENRRVSGRWEFVLKPDNGGTRLTVNASGVAFHPMYRITSQSVIDDEIHLKEFVDALAAKPDSLAREIQTTN